MSLAYLIISNTQNSKYLFLGACTCILGAFYPKIYKNAFKKILDTFFPFNYCIAVLFKNV